MVAIDADRRQIDDRAQMPRVRQRIAECREHRVAFVVGRRRDQHVLGGADGVAHFGRRDVAVEHQCLQPSGEM